MGREIKRVALDFEWPMGKTWEGFLQPEQPTPAGEDCPDCEGGTSPYARTLEDKWYGYLFFSPEETGSVPFGPDHPIVRSRATRNIGPSSQHYGDVEAAIAAEAQRLADLFNKSWSHHLSQEDVDALTAAGRLFEFTHAWTKEDGWQPVDPPVQPTAAQVNEWSLQGIGHDWLNAQTVIEARCEREGTPLVCTRCNGRGKLPLEGQAHIEDEPWKATPPPAGPGWQVWETVTEGSPVSPVFATSDELADWIADPDRDTDRMWWVPKPVAAKFIEEGWAPSFVSTPATGLISGVEWVGTTNDDQGTENT